MSKYPVALQRYVETDVLEERDLHAAAAFIEVAQRSGEGEVPELVWLAVALALGAFRDQHMCIDLEYIAKWAEEKNPDVWRDALMSCGYVVVEPSAAGVCLAGLSFSTDTSYMCIARGQRSALWLRHCREAEQSISPCCWVAREVAKPLALRKT